MCCCVAWLGSFRHRHVGAPYICRSTQIDNRTVSIRTYNYIETETQGNKKKEKKKRKKAQALNSPVRIVIRRRHVAWLEHAVRLRQVFTSKGLHRTKAGAKKESVSQSALQCDFQPRFKDCNSCVFIFTVPLCDSGESFPQQWLGLGRAIFGNFEAPCGAGDWKDSGRTRRSPAKTTGAKQTCVDPTHYDSTKVVRNAQKLGEQAGESASVRPERSRAHRAWTHGSAVSLAACMGGLSTPRPGPVPSAEGPNGNVPGPVVLSIDGRSTEG
ncbi:hypothetical protein BDY21DRAFT_130594 [Lineolata rhizophorae]|uniref:Uncharacterized protein n=1 Tax=Lineolata rhizophorae TaxID=578093 RepID=A0A6A6P9Y7_9PEZI|nr:hypothetical protein BDY21DRAFT_130594 [Lineolata rhizophorae]